MLHTQQQQRWTKWALLAPSLLLIILTAVYPMANAFWLSFQDWRLQRSPVPTGFVGLEHYVRAFGDENFINSVWVTIVFTVISVGLTIVLGMGMALILFKRSRMNIFIRSMLIFPFAVSPALKGFSWRFMLNPEYGIYAVMLGVIPGLRGFVWLGDTFWAIFWLAMSEVWGWAPLYALMFIGALGSIPTDIFEAARVDGATSTEVFWHITLPMLKPVLIVATLLKTIFSLKMFDQVVTMTGGGPGGSTTTLNFYVYQTGFRFFDMGYSAALAYILVVALAIFAFFYVRALYGRQGV